MTQPGQAKPWTTVLDGRLLRQLRRQHGLSQEALADRAGISLTTMARLERKPRTPCRTRTLARLAAALGEHPGAMTPGNGTEGITGQENKGARQA